MNGLLKLVAELKRTKRASEAPWVNKTGDPSSRENLVMTSAYERTSFVRTDSGGGGGASRDNPHGRPYGKLRNVIFPSRFFLEKSENTRFYLPCQQTIPVSGQRTRWRFLF